MKVTRFLLRDVTTKGEIFHLDRKKISSHETMPVHTHDYAEMIWVEDGNGTHLINEEEVPLQTGDFIMLRSEDEHAFLAGKQGLTIMLIGIAPKTVQYFRKRYFSNSADFFWKKGPLPYHITLDDNTLRDITHMAEKLRQYQHSPLHLDSFLLSVFKLLLPVAYQPHAPTIPAWLNNAVRQFPLRPDIFRLGAQGFASLCGRNTDYVNRTVRKYYNKTLSALVTELRMQFAARQLAVTNIPIKSICHDCGFNNLAHFYKQFQRVYQQTPSQYRIHQQRS